MSYRNLLFTKNYDNTKKANIMCLLKQPSSKKIYMNSLKHKVQEISLLFKGIPDKKQQLFFQVCYSIFSAKGVCLYRIADEADLFPQRKTAESRYKILTNFFCTGLYDIYLEGIFFVIIHLFGQTKEAHLAIDRTDWQIGGRRINLLVIGIVYQAVCIPLVWEDLGRKGNSNAVQRLNLLDKLLQLWKRTGLEVPILEISGDREFIGDEWLLGLEKRKMLFVLRFKENQQFYVFHKRQMSKEKVSLKKLSQRLQKRGKAWTEIVTASGYIVKLVIIPNTGRYARKNPFLFLITNIEKDGIKLIQQKFSLRWKIECCFKHIKSNGFNIEDIRLEGQHKVHLMMGILTLLYALCIHQGIWSIKQKPEKPIFYQNGTSYKRKSVFRHGLSKLKAIISKPADLVDFIKNLIIKNLPKTNYRYFKKHINLFYSQ